VKEVTSNINEVMAPVIGQLRSQTSPAVDKQAARNSADTVQESNVVKPSPGDTNRVEDRNENGKPSKETIEKAVIKANELSRSLSSKLSFTYDTRIERVIVKVMEGDGEKVIRQVPPEEMIRLALRMDEIMGVLINQSA
jgi:flagellar protein FlaG